MEKPVNRHNNSCSTGIIDTKRLNPDRQMGWLVQNELQNHFKTKNYLNLARILFPDAFEPSLTYSDIRSKAELPGKIARFKNKPNPEYLKIAEEKCPGSTKWYSHPFRQIAMRETKTPKELYACLRLLSPSVTKIIFRPKEAMNSVSSRKDISNEEHTELLNDSSFDTLTAFLGLAIEAEMHGDDKQYYAHVKYAEEVALRVLSEPPLSLISHEIFTYLQLKFFHISSNCKQSNSCTKYNAFEVLSKYKKVARLIDELHLRKHLVASIPSCLYLAVNLVTEKQLNTFFKYQERDQWVKIKNHPSVIQLGWAIRKREVFILCENARNNNKSVNTSKLSHEKRNQRSSRISPGGQLYRNTQMRGLHTNDHDAEKG